MKILAGAALVAILTGCAGGGLYDMRMPNTDYLTAADFAQCDYESQAAAGSVRGDALIQSVEAENLRRRCLNAKNLARREQGGKPQNMAPWAAEERR